MIKLEKPDRKPLYERLRNIFLLGAITAFISCISLMFVYMFAGAVWHLLSIVYLVFGVIGSYAISKMAKKEMVEIVEDYADKDTT